LVRERKKLDVFPYFIDTLERLANERNPVELFYRGEMAEEIINEMADNGMYFLFDT